VIQGSIFRFKWRGVRSRRPVCGPGAGGSTPACIEVATADAAGKLIGQGGTAIRTGASPKPLIAAGNQSSRAGRAGTHDADGASGLMRVGVAPQGKAGPQDRASRQTVVVYSGICPGGTPAREDGRCGFWEGSAGV
jgi:hypothetical protein